MNPSVSIKNIILNVDYAEIDKIHPQSIIKKLVKPMFNELKNLKKYLKSSESTTDNLVAQIKSLRHSISKSSNSISKISPIDPSKKIFDEIDAVIAQVAQQGEKQQSMLYP